MEYSTQRLAERAGVTTRTLRWYDKLGLLRPSRIAESGYRFYGPAEVDRLQQILFYRALGVELSRIKEILDDPSFDRLQALRSHLSELQRKEREIQGIINAVKETIFAVERNEIMSDQAKFEAFKRRVVKENEQRYGSEIRQKYGNETVDKANADIMNLTQEQYGEWTRLGQEIQEKLEKAVGGGEVPSGEMGKELAQLHRKWLSFSLHNSYDTEKHRGIVQLYVMDQRFQAYYDKKVAGCARFLRDAVLYWIK